MPRLMPGIEKPTYYQISVFTSASRLRKGERAKPLEIVGIDELTGTVNNSNGCRGRLYLKGNENYIE